MNSSSSSELRSCTTDFSTREYPMRDKDFGKIQYIARLYTGIELGDHKKEMIYGRLVRCVRRLKLASFEQYLAYLEENCEQELTQFINAITTNLTAFFRESHHFGYLENKALPEIQARNSATKRLRIWSAGCSTGEEAYSIAMVVDRYLGSKGWDIKLLATDLDTRVLEQGRSGVYPIESLANIDRSFKNRYFEQSLNSPESRSFKVKPVLRDYVRFNQLNLLGEWPMKGKFDILFCRNVVIYFSKTTQRTLFERFANILNPQGYLFIGHSESLHNVTTRFHSLGGTMYSKVTE